MAKATQATAFPKGHDRWTKPQANALLRAVEDMFHRRDVDALVHGFTEDCVVRFAEQPERRGRAALRQLFTARLARQKDYRLAKTLMVQTVAEALDLKFSRIHGLKMLMDRLRWLQECVRIVESLRR